MSIFNIFKHYEVEAAGESEVENVIYELQPNGTTKKINVPDDVESDCNA